MRKKRIGFIALCLVAALYGWGCASGTNQGLSRGKAGSATGRNAKETEDTVGKMGSNSLSDAQGTKAGAGQKGEEAIQKALASKAGTKGRTATGTGEKDGTEKQTGEEAGTKRQTGEEAGTKRQTGEKDDGKKANPSKGKIIAPVVSLPAQMQNEERIAPPEPEPGKLAEQAEITTENAADEIPQIFSTPKESLIFSEGGLDYDNGEEYTNQDGDVYGFDMEGNLVSYQSSMDTEVYVAPKASQDACREAAECYLPFLVEDPSYYTLDEVFYHASQHIYSFAYRHYIQGVASNDQILISVHDASRSLVYFQKPRPGVFREMDEAGLDEGQIFQKAQEMFRQKHPQEHMAGAKLIQITVYQEDKKYAQGRVGYLVDMDFEIEDDEICACETRQFVPFEEVAQ
ncbi:MAG: hypothetical protein HFH39_02715 [Lachnospiraceae bacterium]|nr:hypothetical protein [Lachnospiraceae bacterium]